MLMFAELFWFLNFSLNISLFYTIAFHYNIYVSPEYVVRKQRYPYAYNVVFLTYDVHIWSFSLCLSQCLQFINVPLKLPFPKVY